MRIIALFIISLICLLNSCSEGPKSEESLIDESLILNQEALQGRKYYIDSVKSFISWVSSNEESRHYGIVHILNGFIMIKDSMIVGGDILIDMSKIETLDLKDNPAENARLSALLNSKEIFYVSNFPVARFEIDSAQEMPSSSNRLKKSLSDPQIIIPTHLIFGKLTIRGTTQILSFPAKIDMRYYQLQSSADFTLSRNELGLAKINHTQPTPDPGTKFPDLVNIGFDIIATAR